MSASELARLGTCALLLRRAGAMRLVADIDEALAAQHAREQASGADRFTSDDLPPGVSRRTFREVVKASGLGEKDGQEWSIAKMDWYSVRRASKQTKQTASKTEANTLAIATPPAANDVDAMLTSAGLRASRDSANPNEKSRNVTRTSRRAG